MRVGVVEGAAAAATAVTLCVTALSFSRPAAHEAAAFWRQNIGEGSTTYLNKTRITLNSGQQLVEICISRDRPDRQSKTELQSYEQKNPSELGTRQLFDRRQRVFATKTIGS